MTNEDMEFRCPTCGKIDTGRRNRSIIEANRRGISVNDIAKVFRMQPTYVRQILRSVRLGDVNATVRRDRNYAMYLAWYNGSKVKDVAKQFNLSYSRTGTIINMMARKEGYRLPKELRQKLTDRRKSE